MKQLKYTEEQIFRILKEAAAGIKLTDLYRKYGSVMRLIITGRQNTAVWASAQ